MRKKSNSRAATFVTIVLLSSAVMAHVSPALPVREPVEGNRELVALAERYEGLNENTHRRQLGKILGVDPIDTPWCAAFINVLLRKQGLTGTGQLSVESFRHWGIRTTKPLPGDIVVMNGHVSIFVGFSSDGKEVIAIGGNQDDSVKVNYYPLRQVQQFRTYNKGDDMIIAQRHG